MRKKFSLLVRRYYRCWITVAFHGIRCGRCSACLSDYRFPCLKPTTLRLRRSILGGDYFANCGDDCPF